MGLHCEFIITKKLHEVAGNDEPRMIFQVPPKSFGGDKSLKICAMKAWKFASLNWASMDKPTFKLDHRWSKDPKIDDVSHWYDWWKTSQTTNHRLDGAKTRRKYWDFQLPVPQLVISSINRMSMSFKKLEWQKTMQKHAKLGFPWETFIVSCFEEVFLPWEGPTVGSNSDPVSCPSFWMFDESSGLKNWKNPCEK